MITSIVVAAATAALTGATCINRAGTATPACVLVIAPGHATITTAAKARRMHVRETVDLRGRWVAPGYIDNHVHLGRVAPAPEMWLRAGVTSLVDNGSNESPAELSRRYANGPRIDACGPIITKKGGYPAVVASDAPALEVSGREDASRATRTLIEREHPACVKIAVERGFLPGGGAENWPMLDADEVRAIVHEAHARGLRVRAHVTERDEFDLAVEAGVDVVAHAPIERLPDRSLQRAARRGVAMVSTVALWPADLQAVAADNLVRYAKLGGAIAIGSDYPNWKQPGFPRAELRILYDAGMKPAQLLRALVRDTVDPQRAITDFVVLRRDPRESIDAMADVELVVRDGVIVSK